MKKKLNILFSTKIVKLLFLLFPLFLSLIIAPFAFSQISNPFLNSNKSKESIYSEGKRTVLIVLDASGSMEEKINGETKIHIAKRVLENVLLKAASEINIGLRVYGAQKPSGNLQLDCNDSRLVVVPGINNRRNIISEAYKILPRGFTPITYSISQAVRDLEAYNGEKSVVLISDGLETCGGDPCEFSKLIGASGINLKVDVVGFGVKDDLEAQKQLMCISLSTNGRYFLANNDQELTNSLSESINKNVSGRIITMFNTTAPNNSNLDNSGDIYKNLPLLQPEKLLPVKK